MFGIGRLRHGPTPPLGEREVRTLIALLFTLGILAFYSWYVLTHLER